MVLRDSQTKGFPDYIQGGSPGSGLGASGNILFLQKMRVCVRMRVANSIFGSASPETT